MAKIYKYESKVPIEDVYIQGDRTKAYNKVFEKQKPIFKENLDVYNKKKGVRVGDYITDDKGNYTRVTYIWRNEKDVPLRIQTGGNSGSYYLGKGYISYSGSLDSGYEPQEISKLPVGKKKGDFWTFKNNLSGADRGISASSDFRVFKAKNIK